MVASLGGSTGGKEVMESFESLRKSIFIGIGERAETRVWRNAAFRTRATWGKPAPQPVPCTLVYCQPIRSRPARNARTFLIFNSQILLLTCGPESFWQRDGPPQPSPVPLYAALRPCSSPPYFRTQKKNLLLPPSRPRR